MFASDKEYQHRLRELIEDAVKIRLNAVSGLVGAELSGGLDSGVIDILIIEKLDKEYWQKYLDYDAVDKFRESGEPDEEEVFGQYNMFSVIWRRLKI